jgi:hypothetical protein
MCTLSGRVKDGETGRFKRTTGCLLPIGAGIREPRCTARGDRVVHQRGLLSQGAGGWSGGCCHCGERDTDNAGPSHKFPPSASTRQLLRHEIGLGSAHGPSTLRCVRQGRKLRRVAHQATLPREAVKPVDPTGRRSPGRLYCVLECPFGCGRRHGFIDAARC